MDIATLTVRAGRIRQERNLKQNLGGGSCSKVQIRSSTCVLTVRRAKRGPSGKGKPVKLRYACLSGAGASKSKLPETRT